MFANIRVSSHFKLDWKFQIRLEVIRNERVVARTMTMTHELVGDEGGTDDRYMS